MSVMKYKDASGNWVEVDSVLAGGQLKIDWIERATENSYDLTKYANCNDFLLFFNNSGDRVSIFSPKYNADGSLWTMALGAETSTFSNDDFIASLFSPRQAASSLDGVLYNLTKYENGILTYLSQDSYGENYVSMHAFVIYAE